MLDNKIKILLSAAGTLASVSYINHLKARGYYVIGMNSEPNTVGRYVCDEYYQSPCVNDEKNYISFIGSLDFDIFLPWLDEEHLLFAKEKNLKIINKILTSPPDSIITCIDKQQTFLFAKRNGIDIAEKTNQVPAFIRKRFSRGSKGANKVLDQSLLDSLNKEDYIIQEVLEGDEYTIDCLCDNFGVPKIIVPRKRVLASNVSLIGRIEMNKELIDFSSKILKNIKLIGPINIQVIKSNSKLYLIEINPRLAGTSILTINAGVDLLSDAISIFLGKEIDSNYKIKDGLTMYRFYNEIYV